MKIKEIISQTNHRPFNHPNLPWQFYQEWNNVVFLHWKVNTKELQKFIPSSLEIDLFKGDSWVSLVAFTMENVRPKHLPSLSMVSNFDEINIRTYVKYKEKTGVYFLSIEAGKKLSAKLSNYLSKMPYRFSKMKRNKNYYCSENNEFKDFFTLDYRINNTVKSKKERDIWLTERYAVFQDYKNDIYEFQIHHLEWEIENISINLLKINYPRFSKLVSNNPDVMHFSKGIQVISFPKIQHKIV